MLDNPDAFPLISDDTIEFRFEIPETLRLPSVPTDVMLGWEGWETTRATLAFATLPTRFEALMLESPDAFVATSKPFTVRLVRVPTDVMLGWAGCTTELAVDTVSVIAFACIP